MTGYAQSSFLAAAVAAVFMAACASAPAPEAVVTLAGPELPAPNWRRIVQQEQRFSVYVSEPAVREGDTAKFRMVYVYQPEQVYLAGREVAWQEYSTVTLDCAAERVILGRRTRYDPSGAAFGQDEDNTSAQIMGAAVFRAQEVYCRNKPWEGMNVVPGGAGWMERARAAILTDKPF